MYWIYSLLFSLAILVSLPYWVFRAVRDRAYARSFAQRIGARLPAKTEDRPLWIHSVSVGETLAARALISAIHEHEPHLPILLSTVTPTGQSVAQRELGRVASTFYFPFDWQFSVRRFLRRIEPRAVVLLESELWPNFLRLCSRRKIPVFVANGRVSTRSLQRYRRARWWARRLLGGVDIIAAQSAEDRRRFIELGATAERVSVTGNLKFDLGVPSIQLDSPVLSAIRSRLSLNIETPCIVIGSSMVGEEGIFLSAYQRVLDRIPEVRLILAPRHPSRFQKVASLLADSGLSYGRRTDLTDEAGGPTKILLLDTMGELRLVYALASVAVIGGSFSSHGGHNFLEPAALGKAIVFGPDMSNFLEIARLFIHEHAAKRSMVDTLAQDLIQLLTNPKERSALGERAEHLYRQNQGAAANTVRLLMPRIV